MQLSNIHHQELLNIEWKIRRIDNKTYYLKSIFKEKGYLILITDLRLVWFEHGNFKRIQQNAKVPNIDIETEKEAIALLVRVRKLFSDSESRTTIQRDSSQLLINCKPAVSQYRNEQQNSIINAFSWTFHCELLNQQATEDGSFKTGPQVIYDHFIQPSQAIVNYFTENMLGTI
ncbi:MAG: hypothetical protein EXX96DRAFT_546213 [Benjaminiella poitrasii]|nr:MAG: hypothetical protein EXX96DRAFT_546213 [Benjaminiella poitrasii]